MLIRRRDFLGLAGLAAAGWPVAGHAQKLDKSVRIIVGYGAGGAADTLARYVGDQIGKVCGCSVVVENRPGANGNIAAEAAKRAPDDMHTLLVSGSSTHAANVSIYKSLAYDPERDFTPITTIAYAPFVLITNLKRVRQKSLKEFVDWAKSGGGQKLLFASTSVGSRVASERFRQLAGIDAVNVPYRLSSQAMTDLMGGQYDFYFCDAATALPQIEAGNVGVLAVSVRERLAGLPNVPTMMEEGFANFDIASWIAMWSAVASTPPDVTARLARWATEALDSPEGKKFLLGQSLQPVTNGPDALAELQRRDTAVWGKIIREAGIQQN